MRGSLHSLTLAGCAALLIALGATPAHAAEGDVSLMKAGGRDFDSIRSQASPDQRRWIRSAYRRIRAYAPAFDSTLSWYPDAWAYQDLYAVYADSREDGTRLPFVLKDLAGGRLFIPWGCSRGGCPQYAGDPGSAAFRSRWLADARAKLAAGYKGLYVDDVNLEPIVGDARGQLRTARDPRIGAAMTKQAWRRYVVEFAEQIRATFPRSEIVHNSPWWASRPSDPIARRQVKAADWLVIEHAFTDSGLTGGRGRFGFRALMGHIDALHRLRRRVILESSADGEAGRRLLLAGYLMVSNGRDLLASDERTNPADLWPGYRARLGRALGRRYRWGGVWRRDFVRGTALLSEPGSRPRRLVLRGRSLGGRRIAGVRLRDRAGAVVIRRNRRR